jgi:hypothetical protein
MHDRSVMHQGRADEVTILEAKVGAEPERGFEQSRCGSPTLKRYGASPYPRYRWGYMAIRSVRLCRYW